jgi:hypothetical protein
MTRDSDEQKCAEKFTAERCTLSMYTLKLNGSSTPSIIDDMDEDERVLLLNSCPLSGWKNMGRSASSATIPEKKEVLN